MIKFLSNRMSRKKYVLFFCLIVLLWGLSIVIGSELVLNEVTGNFGGHLAIQSFLFIVYFLLFIFSLRRVADIIGKEGSSVVNVIAALVIASLTLFAPFFKPKYLLIVQIVIGFIPGRNKVDHQLSAD